MLTCKANLLDVGMPHGQSGYRDIEQRHGGNETTLCCAMMQFAISHIDDVYQVIYLRLAE